MVLEEGQVVDRSYGASIRLDGLAVGVFLDRACPVAAGEYAYMPVRAVGHYTMSVAARDGRRPRCTWSWAGCSASFDVVSIPRVHVLLIDKVVVAGTAEGSTPIPPWVVDPRVRDALLWTMFDDAYVSTVWRPFWDLLTEAEREAYLLRHPPPPGWERFLGNVAMDGEWARIDAEDIASGVLQPNGSPWPEPVVARPSLWRRLFRRR